MATKSFNENTEIKDNKAMTNLEAAKQSGCKFGYVKPITTEERDKQKQAAKEWMSRR